MAAMMVTQKSVSGIPGSTWGVSKEIKMSSTHGS